MTTRNVLVVALDDVPEADVRQAIETRKKSSDVSVLVVAPTTHVGPLRWLTGDEDEARAEAAELAGRAAEAIDADVHAEVGDHDPLLAVEDALRTFPADEIVLAGPTDDDTEAALQRFHLPISRLGSGAATGDEAGPVEPLAPRVTRGRSAKTPAMLLALVLGVVATGIVLISLITYLVVWLV